MLWFSKRQDSSDRLATLSRRLDDAESTLRMLKTEWLDTLERLERMVGRFAKRREREAAREATPEAEPGEGANGQSPSLAGLDEVAVRRSPRRFPGQRG